MARDKKIELDIDEVEGIKAIDSRKFYRSIPQFNLEIPKYQYIDKII